MMRRKTSGLAMIFPSFRALPVTALPFTPRRLWQLCRKAFPRLAWLPLAGVTLLPLGAQAGEADGPLQLSFAPRLAQEATAPRRVSQQYAPGSSSRGSWTSPDPALRLSGENSLESGRTVDGSTQDTAAGAMPPPSPAPQTAEAPAFHEGQPSVAPSPPTAANAPGASDLQVVEVKAPPPIPRTIDLTRPTDDLWDRIRNGFAMPDLQDDVVLQQQQWFMNRPDYLRRVLERARPYMYHIVDELERRGMPTELALLPIVESAYNPMAYSRAHASGLWQFIPTTGKNFKLNQTWWTDQRRDIVASTSAALDYLQSLYEMQGDWALALASYNWGEGAVARAMNRNRAKGLSIDYLSLSMPAETRAYVPKLQALKNIFSDPRVMASLDLPTLPNRPYFSTVDVPGEVIDVKVAAKLADMPVDQFIALNPAHNRPVIRAGEANLVLPADRVDVFRANLEEHQSADKPLSNWSAYTLKAGDRLDKVASRFGMSVAQLKSVNGLNPKSKPTPGLTLLVPSREGVDDDALNNLGEAASQTTPQASSPPAPALAATASSNTSASLPQSPNSYTVHKGDTLASVSRRFGVSVAELKKLNGLGSKGKLSPGTQLTLAPRPATPATASTTPSTTVAALKANGKADNRHDTGRDTGHNSGRDNPPRGRVKEQIAATSDHHERASKNTRAEREDRRSKTNVVTRKSPSPTRTSQYTVRPGDTLSSIAHHFRVEATELQRLNRLSDRELKPGKTLTLMFAQN